MTKTTTPEESRQAVLEALAPIIRYWQTLERIAAELADQRTPKTPGSPNDARRGR